MKLEKAIEIVLDIARHPLTNEHKDEDALEATNVVEDFFVNNVFDGADEGIEFLYEALGGHYRRDAIERMWTLLCKHKDNPENAKSELCETNKLSESEYSEVLNAFKLTHNTQKIC